MHHGAIAYRGTSSGASLHGDGEREQKWNVDVDLSLHLSKFAPEFSYHCWRKEFGIKNRNSCLILVNVQLPVHINFARASGSA